MHEKVTDEMFTIPTDKDYKFDDDEEEILK
jgi:hypothetical protein